MFTCKCFTSKAMWITGSMLRVCVECFICPVISHQTACTSHKNHCLLISAGCADPSLPQAQVIKNARSTGSSAKVRPAYSSRQLTKEGSGEGHVNSRHRFVLRNLALTCRGQWSRKAQPSRKRQLSQCLWRVQGYCAWQGSGECSEGLPFPADTSRARSFKCSVLTSVFAGSAHDFVFH